MPGHALTVAPSFSVFRLQATEDRDHLVLKRPKQCHDVALRHLRRIRADHGAHPPLVIEVDTPLVTFEPRQQANRAFVRGDRVLPGTKIPLGEATVTLVAGWGQWTGAGPTESERRNAISVVLRLDYRGRSVLFTGDTVGRRLTDSDDACKDAEQIMVANHTAGTVSLKADVLIAPHHGANNGSSTCFITAVAPEFVVFASGHDHKHPTLRAAARFMTRGVPATRLFRTDLGDDESGAFEWKGGSIPGCNDPAGDDDVEIALRATGVADVDYLRTPSGCDSRIGT